MTSGQQSCQPLVGALLLLSFCGQKQQSGGTRAARSGSPKLTIILTIILKFNSIQQQSQQMQENWRNSYKNDGWDCGKMRCWALERGGGVGEEGICFKSDQFVVWLIAYLSSDHLSWTATKWWRRWCVEGAGGIGVGYKSVDFTCLEKSWPARWQPQFVKSMYDRH